uniref:Uncharacterized protein n=1 Tax=Ananas comosus var. bracteatus TaxID=296719 RepID=A0A6V7NGI4_ANACO|nr:unnamed protein product [Ananas comosus var. bracteatus]
MAMTELESAEFWLPSEFLGDDYYLEEAKVGNGVGLGFGSSLDSPVESAESDEEDYMAGLTRRMAHSFLLDDDKEPTATQNPKPRVMAGSPQSTLCAMGLWSSSGHDSPNGPSQVPSPPSSPLETLAEDPWDLLNLAADEVMRMSLHEQGNHRSFNGVNLSVPAQKPSSPPIRAPPKNPNPSPNPYPNGGYYTTPLMTQRQVQVAQFHHLRQQQLLKQQQQQQQQIAAAAPQWGKQSKRSCVGGGEGRYARPLGLSPAAWPPLQKTQLPQPQPQPQRGSGMRAIFLTGAGAKKESAGTGVFLPRRAGAPPSPAKNQVVLPCFYRRELCKL